MDTYFICKKQDIIFGCISGYKYGLVTWSNPIKSTYYVSRYTPKNGSLFLIFTFVANYDYDYCSIFFCDDIESHFDLHDVTKNSSTTLQVFDYPDNKYDPTFDKTILFLL